MNIPDFFRPALASLHRRIPATAKEQLLKQCGRHLASRTHSVLPQGMYEEINEHQHIMIGE